jgi:hypothetical protein
MYRKPLSRHILGLVLVLLVSTGAGCNWADLAGNAASFALGVLTASQITTTTVEYHCFQGGVEVECGDLVPTGGP